MVDIKRLMFLRSIFACILLVHLAACESGVRRTADPVLSRPQYTEPGKKAGSVTLAITDAARQEAASNLEFDANRLLHTVRQALLVNGVLSTEEDLSRDRIEVTVTSIRVRSTFSAVMWGFMAGDDHINGNVVVRSPSGETAQTFSVSASYALGGIIGGLDETRMGWLYETFAKHVVEELTGRSEVAEIGPVEPVSGSPVATVNSFTSPSTSGHSRLASGIKALFSGARLSRDQGSDKFIEEFASDGTVKGQQIAPPSSELTASVAKDQGTWSMDNEGRLCLGWSRWDGGQTKCLAVSSNGNTIRLLSPSGTVLRKYTVLSRPKASYASLNRKRSAKLGMKKAEEKVPPTGVLTSMQLTKHLRNKQFKSVDEYSFFGTRAGRDCFIIVTFKADGEIDGKCQTSVQTASSIYRSGRWDVGENGALCLKGAFFGVNKKCYHFTKKFDDFVLVNTTAPSEKYEFRRY